MEIKFEIEGEEFCYDEKGRLFYWYDIGDPLPTKDSLVKIKKTLIQCVKIINKQLERKEFEELE